MNPPTYGHLFFDKGAKTIVGGIAKLVKPLWTSVWWFLRKLDIVLPVGPAIPLLGIYPEDVSTGNKDTLQYVHSSPIYNIQKLERTQMSLREEWIQKMWYIYTMEYYSAIKRMNLLNSSANGWTWRASS